MIKPTHSLRDVRLMIIGLMMLIMVTACSGGQDSQIQSQEISNAAMAASSNFSAQIPKVVESAQKSVAEPTGQAVLEQSQPAQESAPVQQSTEVLLIPEGLPAEPELEQPLVAEPLEPAPSEATELQNVVPPAVDLSLAVEPQVGFRAPDFTLQAVDGQTYRLGDLLGRHVVLNYWATWCVPCKQELPILEKLHREYGQKGVVFISINALDQDSLDKVNATVGEFGMTFPVLLDQERFFADNYRAIFFPTTFLIDASGVIREISLGDSTEEELRGSLEKLLSGNL